LVAVAVFVFVFVLGMVRVSGARGWRKSGAVPMSGDTSGADGRTSGAVATIIKSGDAGIKSEVAGCASGVSATAAPRVGSGWLEVCAASGTVEVTPSAEQAVRSSSKASGLMMVSCDW
jgi:hypothetical protein